MQDSREDKHRSSRREPRTGDSRDRDRSPSHRSRHRREYSRSPSRERRGSSKRHSRHPSESPERRGSKDRDERRSSSKRSSKDKRKSHRRHKHKDARESDSDGGAGGYTNADNPFNDTALGKKFVWKKKQEQDKALGLTKAEIEQTERQRREEAERELENLRKRREQRELEKELRDQEMARLRKEAEQEKLGDWERKEEEFHLRQAKKRAEIRIKNHRPKPIDILAMNLRLANEQLDDEEACEIGSVRLDVERPDRIVECLGLEECEELKHDVDMYLSLESNARNVEFWENLMLVCTAHLESLDGDGGGRGGRLVVERDIREMLAGKSLEELVGLESDVQKKLGGQSGAVDVDYWEQVRRQLEVEKAKATLAEMHQEILERRLDRLREARSHAEPKGARASGGNESEAWQKSGSEVEQRKRQRLEELQRRILEEQGSGDLPEGGAAQGAAGNDKGGDSSDISRALYEAELRKEHDPSEAIFSVEAAVPTKSYSWQDKHRPRKPRYFNRVHTGYEWNKYNQTHYDKDNPPPKVVQGYKFNIFYPDLIDKSQAPTYRVESDPSGGEDTVVLRFMAGPPYEDIAFRIVNREWEYNRRRGFRNTFDRGVLQLYFRFKRHYYRR